MTAFKGTPGPWVFLEDDYAPEELADVIGPWTIGLDRPPHTDLAQVFSEENATVETSREEGLANARLFAASLGLLVSLEDLELRRNHFHQTLKEFGWGHKYTSRALDDLALSGERARAALDAATKEERHGAA